MPITKVVARRAERIEIDNCGQCPWLRGADHDYGWSCASDGHGDGKPRDMTLEEATDNAAPEWCPIRGMVVIIGGPKNA